MKRNAPLPFLACLLVTSARIAAQASGGAAADTRPWIVIEGKDGPGKGKHIVLISGDEEYRSEEALPQLAKILSGHHGFRSTVLFAVNPSTGVIDPGRQDNIPGLEALRSADLMVIFTRFRKLPDDQMKLIAEYTDSGKPIIGIRTATHAFDTSEGTKYARFGWNSKEWEGGFGRQVLGETWVAHHGNHGSESTRGVIPEGARDHPILRGVKDVWGPTDVYAVRLPLPGDSKPLVLGQVVAGMSPKDPPVTGKKNDPMMPIAWTKTHATSSGKSARVFTTTIGASQDLESEGLRRLLVNACYWALAMEEKIDPASSVAIVGKYEPSPFKFDGFRKGVKPADLVR